MMSSEMTDKAFTRIDSLLPPMSNEGWECPTMICASVGDEKDEPVLLLSASRREADFARH